MVPSQAKPPAAMARSLDMAAMSKEPVDACSATAMSFRSQRCVTSQTQVDEQEKCSQPKQLAIRRKGRRFVLQSSATK